jgi:hypothetical protein
MSWLQRVEVRIEKSNITKGPPANRNQQKFGHELAQGG